jgi:tetratricopeptide (TPR) repeat protein
MKKTILKIAISVIFLTSLVFVFAGRLYSQGNLKEEYEKLKKEYEKVVIDRDNILMQTRNLLDYKEKSQERENLLKGLQEEKTRLLSELETIKTQNSQLEQKSQEEISALKEKIAELESRNAQALQEKELLKNSLEKLEIEYKILPETKKTISRLEMEKKEALRNYNQLKEKFKTLEEERLDKDAQIEINRRQIKEFQKQAEEAMIKNRELEKRAQEIPARFAEMARENKVLIKETALMHYNLGVFYTKNKEYSRATAEFEKATELNPEDPYAHYNLGYIYAEYLVDRSKSIEHFRKFLSLCKTDDKDVDWVRKYILTWQTWGGKKPIQ